MDEIDKIVSAGMLGYRSRMEFIKDAIRDKLLKLRSEAAYREDGYKKMARRKLC